MARTVTPNGSQGLACRRFRVAGLPRSRASFRGEGTRPRRRELACFCAVPLPLHSRSSTRLPKRVTRPRRERPEPRPRRAFRRRRRRPGGRGFRNTTRSGVTAAAPREPAGADGVHEHGFERPRAAAPWTPDRALRRRTAWSRRKRKDQSPGRRRLHGPRNRRRPRLATGPSLVAGAGFEPATFRL